jgi:hypothetical protein
MAVRNAPGGITCNAGDSAEAATHPHPCGVHLNIPRDVPPEPAVISGWTG